MTIDDAGIIRKMLKNKGQYPGDPRAYSIWSYINQEGRTTHAVYMYQYTEDILTSPYVYSPVLLWNKDVGLTEAGRAFLQDRSQKGVKNVRSSQAKV